MSEHILLFLLLDLAIIIMAARLAGAAARRIGQPAVIGEIVAGIMLGPTILGRINEDWPTDLFPSEVPLGPIAQIGLTFFMFLVGLELDTKLMRSQGRRAFQISMSGIIGPLVLGVLVGAALFMTNNEGRFLAESFPEREDLGVVLLFDELPDDVKQLDPGEAEEILKACPETEERCEVDGTSIPRGELVIVVEHSELPDEVAELTPAEAMVILDACPEGEQYCEEGVRPPDQTGRFAFGLFVGAAMCITAFPVLARILVETRLYKTAVGTATLCAAAVDDVFAWILLAAVIGIVETGSPLDSLFVFAQTLVFAVFMALVTRPIMGVLARRYDELGHLTVDMVAIVVIGLMLSAYATQWIGIHQIFGAFIFGAVMPKRSSMTHELTNKIEDFTVVVLLPVFFLVAGLRTDLFQINSVSLLGWLALILAAAVIGKFAGCGIAAKLTGSSTRDSVVVGALMNTRGLTEIVILTIGLELGVLSDVTFAIMVVMALATTFMAAPIVNRLIPRDQILKEIAESEGEPVASALTRILVAIGNPVNAGALVDAAIKLTGERRPAELLFVRLIPTARANEIITGLQTEEMQVDASVESMRRLVEQAQAAGVTARPISFLSDDVGKDLARLAKDQSCDLVLLGWHRASLPRNLIQALVHRTMMDAPCDVAVFVDLPGQGLQPKPEAPVLVALAASDHDDAATRAGLRLAQGLATSIKLVGYLGEREAAETGGESERLALAADTLRQESGVWVVPTYHEHAAIEAAVEESATASVATIGVSDDWAEDDDFGRVASEFTEKCACPVIVVRAAGKTRPPKRTLGGQARRLQRELVTAGRI